MDIIPDVISMDIILDPTVPFLPSLMLYHPIFGRKSLPSFDLRRKSLSSMVTSKIQPPNNVVINPLQ